MTAPQLTKGLVTRSSGLYFFGMEMSVPGTGTEDHVLGLSLFVVRYVTLHRKWFSFWKMEIVIVGALLLLSMDGTYSV